MNAIADHQPDAPLSPDHSLHGDPLPTFDRAPRTSAGPSPLRRPGSVRRTMSLYASWPFGDDEQTLLEGRARDVLTPLDGGVPTLLDEDRMEARSLLRVISGVQTWPPRQGLADLDGARAGGQLRDALDRVLHAERVAGTPLYLLLDDMAGVSLIAPWGQRQWDMSPVSAEEREERIERMGSMEGVCIGFRPRSSALDPDTVIGGPNPPRLLPIENPADGQGWHDFPKPAGANLRRLRRIDVWREDGLIRIDAGFQDSAAVPDGGRVGIHEYSLRATADADARTLLSVEAVPRVLPYAECPAATANIDTLIGTPLAEMRMTVLTRLRKMAGCTHLNDALRALAEVPRLVASLPPAEAPARVSGEVARG